MSSEGPKAMTVDSSSTSNDTVVHQPSVTFTLDESMPAAEIPTSSSPHDHSDILSKVEEGKAVPVVPRRFRKARQLLQNPGCQCQSFHSQSRPSAIWVGRVLFVSFLCLVAALLGLGAYSLQNSAEVTLAQSHFDAIAERAVISAKDLTLRKMLGAITLTSIYSNLCPNAQDWPFCYLQGFEQVGRNLVATSRGRGVAFAPIVQPEQVAEFEDWVYEQGVFPEGSGISSFGRGIFAFDKSHNTTDGRYHDTTGETTYPSLYQVPIPIIQALGPDPSKPVLYMLNYHSIEARGVAMDSSFACAKERPTIRPNNTTSFGYAHCGTLTDITPPVGQAEPGAVIMLPVFPANDVSDIAAFIGSSMLWGDVLKEAFNSEASGIDVVLSTDASPGVAYTYQIVRGVAHYQGSADMHNPKYDSFGRDTILTDVVGHHQLSEHSPVYFMKIYPNSQFFEVYSTNNPTFATAGVVVVIVFTSFLFFLYDALISKENQKNQAIIEGRRRFMRFVSHEVRTPLNSVCMGLKLLQEELATLFRGNAGGSLSTDMPPLLDEDLIDNLLSQSHQMDSGSNNSSITVHTDKEKARDVLMLSKQILGSAGNAIDVLNDLLNYDKIETGQLQLEKSVLDIWSLIDHVVREFQLPYKAKNVDLILDLSGVAEKDAAGSVVGDSMKLTQVFRNLLSNALKFTNKGGTVTVRPSLMKDEANENVKDTLFLSCCEEKVAFTRKGRLEVKVSDTGVGLSEEQVRKLFRAGVQYNSNRLQGGQGSGLGLFIAQGIMKRHGGDLSAASAGLGHGTSFAVSIPLHVTDSHGCQRILEPEPNASAVNNAKLRECESNQQKQPNRKLYVLVVDDAMTNRKLLVRLLQKQGHRCEQAEDGVQAVEEVEKAVARGELFDSILLDYEMPNMNGPTAAQKMCQTEGFSSHTCIVGITGNVLPEDVATFKKCGAHHVLPKPLNIPSLTKLWVDAGLV
ncbi:sensor kinase/phosphatase LuxQ [Seminavis robusta]|uniref:histidine kinase n=1 Tax=Seminavis robusta TaxID=568900 RepID=A0A9N8HZG6_9STRA|nr:sensor kinase/phosphatase LuxQ [Seminavis robusta]|eukprot:Sro2273_g321530.1 sensor kinase/phosphatase LuxQ (965) ;mRNA; f:10126-13388